MKNNLILALMLAFGASLFAVGLFYGFRKRRFVGFSFPSGLTKQYFTVPSAEERLLRCRYEVTDELRGIKVVTLINERMKRIQADEVTYQSMQDLGRYRGESAFETVYHAALRQLQLEGILNKSDVDLCMAAHAAAETETTVEDEPEDMPDEVTDEPSGDEPGGN